MKTSSGQDIPTLLFEAYESEDVSYVIVTVARLKYILGIIHTAM